MHIVIPERKRVGTSYQRVSALIAGGMGQATIIEMC